jgi:hypothetical protein
MHTMYRYGFILVCMYMYVYFKASEGIFADYMRRKVTQRYIHVFSCICMNEYIYIQCTDMQSRAFFEMSLLWSHMFLSIFIYEYRLTCKFLYIYIEVYMYA